ncbi:MAG: hypothetical protein Q4C67_02635 [Deinococcus sp.]|nr:hypothetical protein [Deinococcus sp.]
MTQLQTDIAAFLGHRQPEDREASFDYCYNYFQSFRESQQLSQLCEPEHLPQACLHLGFYLASWGMFRGKAFLLGRSARHYIPLIEVIAATPEEVWAIDIDEYSAENVARLLSYERQIAAALTQGIEAQASVTLTTKVMLGVFGNVPALDTFVFNGLAAETGVKAWQLDAKALAALSQYYAAHRHIFDAQSIHTLDFLRRLGPSKIVGEYG